MNSARRASLLLSLVTVLGCASAGPDPSASGDSSTSTGGSGGDSVGAGGASGGAKVSAAGGATSAGGNKSAGGSATGGNASAGKGSGTGGTSTAGGTGTGGNGNGKGGGGPSAGHANGGNPSVGAGGMTSSAGGMESGGSPGAGGETSNAGGAPGTGGAPSAGGAPGNCPDWVYMGSDPNACVGNLGASCGWTTTNENQGYHCQTTSFGVGCEPGGGGCAGTSGTGGSSSTAGTSSGTGGSPTGAGGSNPTGGGLADILSSSTFDAMFTNTHLPVYSYQGLLDAASAYPAFGNTGTLDDRKREIAAFLANVAHETGELQYVDEIAKDDYCQSSSSCPCEPGQQYYGRGALQLSWNYNYCSAGDALGYDLRGNPGQVSTVPKLAWLTGMWFWMTSTGAGTQTAHDGIASSGFGETIRTINGGLECNGQNAGSAQDRVTHYQTFCQLLGVSPGGNLTC